MAGTVARNTALQFDTEIVKQVAAGLLKPGQKTLPASLLYDPVGSALFEAITVLPEYGLTRADDRLLERHSGAIVRDAGWPDLIIELGSGTGTKTRHLLQSASGAAGGAVYRPIDISKAALDLCQSALAAVPGVATEPIEAPYDEGVRIALSGRGRQTRALLLFLGSTIGNFSRPEALCFLRELRQQFRSGDTFLLGADLLKDSRTLLLAYDDPAGVTAAFNKNLLARINRELGADFDLRQFSHEARFNSMWARIEMHLRAEVRQSVWIEALQCSVQFEPGETIWTESSHKFRAEEIREMGEQAGWRCHRQWVDHEWGFAETLFAA